MALAWNVIVGLRYVWVSVRLLNAMERGLIVATAKTRSQAVARIADRTALQHFWGHVTSSVTCPFDTPYAISY